MNEYIFMIAEILLMHEKEKAVLLVRVGIRGYIAPALISR